MPWRHTFVPNPSDKSIKVRKKLPKGFLVDDFISTYKVAQYPIDKLIERIKEGKSKPIDTKSLYFCQHCNGWLEGIPYQYRQDNIGNRCGRRGMCSSCKRCGGEIGFSGMVS